MNCVLPHGNHTELPNRNQSISIPSDDSNDLIQEKTIQGICASFQQNMDLQVQFFQVPLQLLVKGHP